MRANFLIALAIGVAFGYSCTLITRFEPEGQPCDKQGRCLRGYSCVGGVCRADVCGGCQAGLACDEATRTCVSTTCNFRRCQLGFRCSDSSGRPVCEPITAPALGHPCESDAECAAHGPSRVCYRGRIPLDNAGVLRPGVCVEPCLENDACATSGAVCHHLVLGPGLGTTSLCLPRNALVPCLMQSDCDRDGFVCTLVDHYAYGPFTTCDAMFGGGGGPGAACVDLAQTSAGTPCRNGMCLPQTANAGENPACVELCGEGTCPSGVCAGAAYESSGLIRHVPVCLPELTVCRDCSLDPNLCGPDAPFCEVFGSTKNCLTSCSPDAGSFPVCPPGYNCLPVSGGRCFPLAGTCTGP